MTLNRENETRSEDGSPFVPHGRLPDPFTLVMFGATGDLAARKLFPAVFALGKASVEVVVVPASLPMC